MLAERSIVTFERYIDNGWRTTDPARLREELISLIDETHRWENNFSLGIKDGALIDPATGNIIDFSRRTYLESKEGELFDDLKYWANNVQGKAAAWISPSYEGYYPYNKVIFYRKEDQTLQSTAIVFDTPKDDCLRIAGKLNPLFANFRDSESLRNKLIVFPVDFDMTEIMDIIATPDVGEKQTYSQQKLDYLVRQIKSGRSAKSIALEVQSEGLVGKYGTSCPLGEKNALVLRFVKDRKIIKCVNCPFCKKLVDAEVYDNKIHCPVDKGGCGAELPYTEQKIA